jgi:hypothetical protein
MPSWRRPQAAPWRLTGKNIFLRYQDVAATYDSIKIK